MERVVAWWRRHAARVTNKRRSWHNRHAPCESQQPGHRRVAGSTRASQRSPAEIHVLRHAKDLIHVQLVEVWRLLAKCPLLDLHLLTAALPALMVRLQPTARQTGCGGRAGKLSLTNPGFRGNGGAHSARRVARTACGGCHCCERYENQTELPFAGSLGLEDSAQVQLHHHALSKQHFAPVIETASNRQGVVCFAGGFGTSASVTPAAWLAPAGRRRAHQRVVLWSWNPHPACCVRTNPPVRVARVVSGRHHVAHRCRRFNTMGGYHADSSFACLRF